MKCNAEDHGSLPVGQEVKKKKRIMAVNLKLKLTYFSYCVDFIVGKYTTPSPCRVCKRDQFSFCLAGDGPFSMMAL